MTTLNGFVLSAAEHRVFEELAPQSDEQTSPPDKPTIELSTDEIRFELAELTRRLSHDLAALAPDPTQPYRTPHAEAVLSSTMAALHDVDLSEEETEPDFLRPSIKLPTLESATGQQSAERWSRRLTYTLPSALFGDYSKWSPLWQLIAHWSFRATLNRIAELECAYIALTQTAPPPRLRPFDPGHKPRMWACACGSERLAAPVVPRGPSGQPLPITSQQGCRGSLALAA
ncbi:hypothetical protein [Kitasatospora sp. NPDC059800]|uniref:hypothetical protein n=1 Tax=Kitasatospora sp. NPDC059800 TaxID=3346951 RepID=UPI00365856C5